MLKSSPGLSTFGRLSTMELAINERFKRCRACVIVPTYNNAGTLGGLLRDLHGYTDQVIVVNDGSTDATSDVLAQFSWVSLVSYDKNAGKGWGLRQGFRRAVELGFHFAITIDSDGQHFAEDLPLFLDELERKSLCLIIGKRNMAQAGIPGKSSFGNRFSNFWYWFETGHQLEDTQCGYRLYPIERLKTMHFFTRKFEFEIEVIVRAAWAGIPVIAVPVKIHYAEKGKRISHFRPFRDFLRISVLNTVLVTIALVYIKPRDFFRGLKKKETRTRWREQLFHPDDSALKKSLSAGFGVFMGIVPIWGFQLIAAIALAVLLRLNKAIVILAANISIPPLLPFILYLSHLTGKLWMGEGAIDISFNNSITLSTIRTSFGQYLIGAVSLAIVAGLVVAVSCFLVLKISVKRSSHA